MEEGQTPEPKPEPKRYRLTKPVPCPIDWTKARDAHATPNGFVYPPKPLEDLPSADDLRTGKFSHVTLAEYRRVLGIEPKPFPPT